MADLSLIEWAAPGPYRVAFSTRIGGVSEGDFASLNLGILTEDDPARVFRTARACATRSARIPTARRWPGSGTARR